MIFILILLISFPLFAQEGLGSPPIDAYANAVRDGHAARCNPNDNFTAVIGGIRSCNRFGQTTAQDLNCWDRKSALNFTRTVRDTDQLEEISAGFFYQELAANSQAQAQCRSNVLGAYAANGPAKQRINQAAQTRFMQMKNELHILLQYKAELEKEVHDRTYQALAARMSFDRSSWDKSITEVKETITKLIMSLPMGYDPDVAKAVLKMGETGQWNVNSYQQAIMSAKQKYDASVKYFKDHSEPNSAGGRHYCIEGEFRRAAQKSGQTDAWIDSMPNETRGEKLLRERLRCRLNATYGRGPARISAAFTVAGIAATIFPLTAVPSMAVRGVRVAQVATTFMRGVNAVSLAMQLENTRRACFGRTFMVSAARQCNIAGELDHLLHETSNSACAISVGLTASYIPMQVPAHILRYVRRAVQLSTQRKK